MNQNDRTRYLGFVPLAWAAIFILGFAGVAQASYAQMRLDGIELILAFLLAVAYGVLVDLLLFAGLFRYRAAAVLGSTLGLALACLLVVLSGPALAQTGFAKVVSGRAGIFALIVTSAVFVPFIVAAPLGQHLALRRGLRRPRWLSVWMVVQLALLPAFVALEVSDQYFGQQEYAAGNAAGRRVAAGEFTAVVERVSQRRVRIWGTPWSSPWVATPSAKPLELLSGWVLGVALGLDASAPIGTNEPLRGDDRAALQKLVDTHLLGYAVPHIRAKLLWDALEPGTFSQQLVPTQVLEETIPVLLDRFEKHGAARFCPAGRMNAADRAAWLKLVRDRAQAFQFRPPWNEYLKRAEAICPGAE